jgi:integrase
MKLIERNIAKIKATAARKADHFEWDSEMPGFGLRVRSGRASWVLQYQVHGRSHRIKLGEHPIMSADQARSSAKVEAGNVEASGRHGEDHPIQAKQRIADERRQAEAPGNAPFASKVQDYIAARTENGNGLRERSVIETTRYLTQYFKPLEKLPLNKISRFDVATILNGIKAPAARNRARSTLSAFFAWAIGEGLCDVNPVVGTNKAEENKERDRVLTEAEIAAVWLNAGDANGYGTILKLLLLTGCRRDEIGGLRWSEIDLNERKITLSGSRTKNGQEHVVPLSDLAMSILAGIPKREGREHVFGRTMGAGFSGWSSAKAEFDEIVKLDPWTVHDLRRTVRTEIDKLGTLPHVCEAVLNHLPEKLIRTYNRNTYEGEKRAALDKWAHHLKTIVAQASGANVTTLSRKQSPKA